MNSFPNRVAQSRARQFPLVDARVRWHNAWNRWSVWCNSRLSFGLSGFCGGRLAFRGFRLSFLRFHGCRPGNALRSKRLATACSRPRPLRPRPPRRRRPRVRCADSPEVARRSRSPHRPVPAQTLPGRWRFDLSRPRRFPQLRRDSPAQPPTARPHRSMRVAKAEARADSPAPRFSSCGAVSARASIYACSGL